MEQVRAGVLLMGDLPARELAHLAKSIEDWGYDYLWLADERFFREVYSSLTLCALNTSRISLGPCVTDPYSRHPALTAMAIATLDEISEGRAVLGIGAGVSGFGELGIDRARPAIAIRETVSLVKRLMAGEEVDFQGRVVQFHGGHLNFAPPRPEVPVYVASNAPGGLRVAGALADGAVISSCASEELVDYAVRLISVGLAESGRQLEDLDVTARLNCCIATRSEDAREAVRMSTTQSLQVNLDFATGAGLEISRALADSRRQLGYIHDKDRLAEVAGHLPDDIIDAMTLAGTVDQIAERVAKIAGNGINQVIIRPVPSPEGGLEATLEAFARQVLPRVRSHD